MIDKAGEEATVVKIASHPLDLFDTGRFKASLSAFSSSVFMGHNRAATKGAVNAVNAHPYHYGDIVGAHNGTLSPATFARLNEKLGEKHDVDSQALFASIDKFGIEETVALLQGSVDKVACPDAWALVWFDFKDRTLNFLRNKERPFWLAYSEKCDKVLWASEYHMIGAATDMSAQDYSLYEEGEEGYRFWATPVDTLYSFSLEELRKGGASPPLPETKELKGKALPAVSTYSGGSPFHRTNTGRTFGATPPSIGTPSSGTPSSGTKSEPIHLFGTKETPFAGFVTKERFDELAKYGCSWCGSDVSFEDLGVSILEAAEAVLCPECGHGDKSHNRVYTKDLTNLETRLIA